MPKQPIKKGDQTRQQLLAQPWFRPLLILVIVTVAVLISVLFNITKPQPYAGAKKTADSFLNALVNCDVKTAEKYYPALNNNPSLQLSFTTDCTKGDYHYSFEKQQDATSKSTKNGANKNVVLIYNLTGSKSASGQIMIYLVSGSPADSWQIFSITLTSVPSPSPNGH